VCDVVTNDRFIEPVALERSLASLRERSAEDGLMRALEQVIAATRDLFEAAGAGLMTIDDQSALKAVAETDEPGRLLEIRQQEIGHGPCVDSLTLDQVISTERRGPQPDTQGATLCAPALVWSTVLAESHMLVHPIIDDAEASSKCHGRGPSRPNSPTRSDAWASPCR
jgi:hypothetical protein